MSYNIRMKRCVICGVEYPSYGKREYEAHAIANSLFPINKFGVVEMIKVSACEKCNLGISSQDEAFRNLLAFHPANANSLLAQDIREKAERAPSYKKTVDKIIKNKLGKRYECSYGFYQPYELYLVDDEEYKKIIKVINCYVRDLFNYDRGRKTSLPQDCMIYIFDKEIAEYNVNNLNNDALKIIIDDCIKWQGRNTVMEDVFEYTYTPCINAEFTGVYTLKFYNVVFWVLIIDKQGLLMYEKYPFCSTIG